MNIKTFIEKAIEGEYNGTSYAGKQWAGIRTFKHPPQTIDDQARFCAVLIDPKSWQAVGKVEGWVRKEKYCPTCKTKKPYKMCNGCNGYRFEMIETEPLFRFRMHRFIDALCDGKDLEQSLDIATT